MPVRGTLNLNLSLQSLDWVAPANGRGKNAASKSTGRGGGVAILEMNAGNGKRHASGAATVQVPGKFYIHGCCNFLVPVDCFCRISTALYSDCANGNE